MMRHLLSFMALLLVWLTASFAGAQLRVAPTQVVLAEGADGRFEGELQLHNDGDAPLVVEEIAPLTSRDAPRLPRGVGIDPGPGPFTIAPGQSLAVRVLWLSSRSRARQLEGHLGVEVKDAPTQGIAVHAARGHQHHLPGGAVVLGLIAAALAGLGRRREAAVVQALALAALVVVAAGFIPGVTSAEGNFGFQWVYRRALFGGTSWYVALDGLSLPLVLAGAALPLAAATRAELVERRAAGVAVHLLGAAVVGMALSLDVTVQLFFWLLAWGAASGLMASLGQARAAATMALVGVVAGALTAHGLGAFRALAPGGFGADGAAIAHVANYPEWSDVAWLDVASAEALKRAWVTTFVGFGFGIPLLGAHAASSAAEREHRLGAGYAVVALALAGSVGWFRLWAVAPPVTLWAAPNLAWLGAVMALVGGLLLLHDPERVAAGSSLTTGGVILGSLASVTPEGMEAAVVAAFGAALAGAWRVASPSRWSRLAAVGAPGSVLFWGPALGITALGARHPHAGALLAIGWTLALVGAGRRRHDDARPSLPSLVFGAVVVVFGLWPAGLLRAVDARALELHRHLDPAGPDQVAASPTTSSPVARR